MAPKIFEHATHWSLFAPTGQAEQDVLDEARKVYGDPEIHMVRTPLGEAYLAFKDGRQLPEDGEIIYRNPDTGGVWLQTDEGAIEVLKNGRSVGTPWPEPKLPTAYLEHKQRDGDQKWGDQKWIPVDENGTQIGPQADELPTEGKYKVVFRNGLELPYEDGAPQKDPESPPGDTEHEKPSGDDKEKSPGLSPGIVDEANRLGMTIPYYPAWAYDPDKVSAPVSPDNLTRVLLNLYSAFGQKEYVPEQLSTFPMDVIITGPSEETSLIEAELGELKREYQEIVDRYNRAVEQLKAGVVLSGDISDAGKRGIKAEIGQFNDQTKAMDNLEPDVPRLLDIQGKLVENVEKLVAKAALDVPLLPDPPGGTTPGSTTPGGTSLGYGDVPLLGDGTDTGIPLLGDRTDTNPTEELLGRVLPGLAAGLGSNGLSNGANQGWGNPLSSALSGLSGLGGLGGNLGANLGASARPIDRLENDDDEDDDKEEDEKDKAVEPLALPVTPTQGVSQAVSGQPAGAEGHDGAVQPASAAGAAAPGAKTTVTLPDGRVVEAPNAQAAEAAQKALDDADGSGDAAQKAYAGTGVEIPSDGKNPGAKVDPSDLQPGDIAKWQDKTMVVVAPGLLAVPGEPDSVITVTEVFEDNARAEKGGESTGFEGFFRPTETDPTLSSAASPPPLTDPQQPAESTPHPGDQQPKTSDGQQPTAPDAQKPTTPGDRPESSALPSDDQKPTSPNDQGPPITQPNDQQAPAQPKSSVAEQDLTPKPFSLPAQPNSSPEPQAAPPSPFEVPAATRSTKQERVAAGQS